MYTVTNIWKGEGYNSEARLIKRVYDTGRTSWEFRDRQGRPYNPENDNEAHKIIKDWKLKEVTQ